MTPMENSEEQQDWKWVRLAESAQGGDRAAYKTLLEEIYPYIRALLAGKVKNPDWIDDIAQEVLISVHTALHTYSSDRPFKPWLKSIVFYRKTDFLRSYYRKDRGNASLDEYENLGENVTISPTSGELKDIEAALSTLSGKQRRMFTLIKLEGYSLSEVAEKMNMSLSAVKVANHRMTLRLKELLLDER